MASESKNKGLEWMDQNIHQNILTFDITPTN